MHYSRFFTEISKTEENRKKREDELFNKEKTVRELQKKRFGYEGDLFKERQKLVKPIQRSEERRVGKECW